jgi:2'-5' RNA ligase superfamily
MPERLAADRLERQPNRGRVGRNWRQRSKLDSLGSADALAKQKVTCVRKYSKIAAAVGMRLASLLGFIETSDAQESPVTAIDIALEPDATMVQRAQAENARLLKAYPQGFTLDATHHPHLTMLQQFVRTPDLDKVYAAASQILAKEKVANWKLRAIKYYYIPAPPLGIAGIVVERTEDLLRLQRGLLDAVAPFVEKSGTTAAFVSTNEGRDIQEGLIDYVANFITVAAGERFNPHVTIGVASEAYLDEMLAEPFAAFTFSPVGASVYQLGTFGSARKKLEGLSLTP